MKILAMMLCLPALWAADALGDWYGVLETPMGKLRIAFHFTRAEGGVKATLDSLDQGATGIPAASATADGLKVAAEWPMIQGKFEGESNAEGTEMKGVWTQGPGSLPITLTRRKFETQAGPAIPLTATERDFLISHLEKSRAELFREIEKLTPEQWKFKPAPERWSAAECAEHLIATEDYFIDLVSAKMIQSPVDGALKRKTQADDEALIARITDRSRRGSAPEMLVPTGKYPTPASARDAFQERRDRAIAFVRTTQEDLRGRVANGLDGYQYFVLMSAHTLRHTAQIVEVKAEAKYPK
jgi:hypothetical protein